MNQAPEFVKWLLGMYKGFQVAAASSPPLSPGQKPPSENIVPYVLYLHLYITFTIGSGDSMIKRVAVLSPYLDPTAFNVVCQALKSSQK